MITRRIQRRALLRQLAAGAATASLCPVAPHTAVARPVGNWKAGDRWAVCYHGVTTAEPFLPYRLAVFDAEEHPPLEPLHAHGIETLGYVSLGEAAGTRAWFSEVKAEGLLLMENEYWKGSYFVDVRDQRWSTRLIEEVIPSVMARGFDGIFVDTLDNPPHLERTDPKRFAGMSEAAVEMMRAIRRRFPDIRIMLNRAFELHASLAPMVNYLLGEATLTEPTDKPGQWKLTDEANYAAYVSKLNAARSINPALQVMTLDYWMPEDKAGIRRIYARQRANGFLPYVATRDLDRVVPEPE